MIHSRWTMGWLRSVGSNKSLVSFAEYSLFNRALSQKRPIIIVVYCCIHDYTITYTRVTWSLRYRIYSKIKRNNFFFYIFKNHIFNNPRCFLNIYGNAKYTFLDGYCSTVQDLLNWFEVDWWFTKLLFFQIDLCVLNIYDNAKYRIMNIWFLNICDNAMMMWR